MNNTNNESPLINSFMPHGDQSRFPQLSRDWEHIDCKASACINNRDNQCLIPSLAKIDDSGKCTGFQTINNKPQ